MSLYGSMFLCVQLLGEQLVPITQVKLKNIFLVLWKFYEQLLSYLW